MDIEFRETKRGEGWRIGDQSSLTNIIGAKGLVIQADGLNSFFNMLETEMPTPKRAGSSNIPKDMRDDFFTFDDFKTALDVFRNHPETISEFIKTDMRVQEFGQSGNEVEYDVQGDFIDMGRHMEGVPEQFGFMTQGKARRIRAKIILDVNIWWKITQSDVEYKAKQTLALIDALEQAGVRCEITALSIDQCQNTIIKIKEYDDPLEIEDLAVVVNPDFLRRMFFRTAEYSKTWEEGYGNIQKMNGLVRQTPEKIASDSNEELTIYITGSIEHKEDVDRSYRQISKLIEWELNKPVSELRVLTITGTSASVSFLSNGARDEATILREGIAVMNSGEE